MSLSSFALAILFLIKLRTGKQINFVNYIDRRYGGDTKKLYRKYENLKKKHVKCSLDVQFLIKCKIYNIFPKFLRFKLYRKSLTSSSFYQSWQSKLLTHELSLKKRCLVKLDSEIETCQKNFFSVISMMDKYLALQQIKRTVHSSKI